MLDVGGSYPGINADAFDMYAEAKIYNGLRWYQAGELNEDLDRMIFDNVRTESMNRGDIQAMHAACELGKRRFQRLLERYGVDTGDERGLRVDGLLRADASQPRSQQIPDGDLPRSDRLARRRCGAPRRAPACRDGRCASRATRSRST